MRFDGIFMPIVTPYYEDFTINNNILSGVINLLVEAGVYGLIVAGTTGEYYAQTMQERFDLMHRIKDMIDGRLPLIVGTGATRTEDSVAYAKVAREVGADAIFVAMPPYVYPTDRKTALSGVRGRGSAQGPILHPKHISPCTAPA